MALTLSALLGLFPPPSRSFIPRRSPMSRSRPRCPALCIQWSKAITIPLCQGSGEQLARTLPLDRKRLLIWDEPAPLTHTGLSTCRQLCLKAGRWAWVTRAKTRRHEAAQGLPSNGPWHHYSKYLFYCSLKKIHQLPGPKKSGNPTDGKWTFFGRSLKLIQWFDI